MSESASFEDLLNEFDQTSPQAQKGEPVIGDKVSGILITIGEEFALVDLGAKSEGRLDLAAIRDAEGQLKYAVGDTVETHVTGKDEERGMLLLGSQHGHKYHGLDELERAYRQGLPVQGQVTGVVKGGCEVQVAGIRAFCPASQIDSRFDEIEDLSEFVGQKLDFRITKFEGGRRPNLVVSRRALLEEEPHAQIKEGTVLTGKEVLQVGQQVEASTNYKTIAEVKQLDARARIKYLKACWAMTRPRIIGRLEHAGGFWWLRDVTDTEGFPLEYPLSDVPKGATVEHGGVFIANDTSEAAKHLRPDRYAVAQFDLAFEKEQQKKGNPLLIRVLPQSIDVLREIPADRIPWRYDSSIALEESVFQAYFEEICEASASQIQSLKQEIGELESQRADIATDLRVRVREREDAENACDVALRARAEIESIHQRLAQEVEDGFAARREQLERETLEHQAALQQRYEDEERALRAEMDAIVEELAAARKQRDRELGEIRSQTDALLYYVKSQIEPLHRLELITDAQWDALFPAAGNARDQTREDWPLFDGKTTQAIDHIQRYLFSKGIGYPWDLLANFHALLCTGDLIILSGLSGSGKTNLVKSYADATGNEARIVPVKPNWTSAEDLLGFHNPLQRAYATTPFLEALFEASRDPERLYIICLDEMNLARVEYNYWA